MEDELLDSEIFEAISHPQRVKILKALARSPLGFSELKRVINVKSSGALDFHLKKMESLVVHDRHGRYTLNMRGYAAVEAINAIEKYGWFKRAFFFNIIIFVLVNLWAYINFSLSINFLTVLGLSTSWIVLYTYWTLVHRRAFINWKNTKKTRISSI